MGLKQFGIIFGAGVIIFLFYSATKSIFVGVVVFLLVGVPALGLAFGKINGRPIYSVLPILLKSFMGSKVLVFHKEAKNFSGQTKLSSIKMDRKEPVKTEKISEENRLEKMKRINQILQSSAKEEEELSKEIR